MFLKKKSKKHHWLALLCVLTMILSVLPVGVAPVVAAETNSETQTTNVPSEVSSASKPEGQVINNTIPPKPVAAKVSLKGAVNGPTISPSVPNQTGYVNNSWSFSLKPYEQGGSGITPKILIIEDADSWGTGYQNEQVLNNLGLYYETKTSDLIADTDLYQYSHILIPSDQPQTFYDNLDSNMSSITDWVYAGGSLQFNANDQGWANGHWNFGPGGITHVSPDYKQQNYIQDIDHPILDGMTDDDFYGWNWVSHGYFENLPEGAEVLLSANADGTMPTLVEFMLGKGHVIASQNTLEWSNAGSKGNKSNPDILPNIINYMFMRGFDTLEWSVSDVDTSLMDIYVDAQKDMLAVTPNAIGSDEVLLTLTDTATNATTTQWITIDIQEDLVAPEIILDEIPETTSDYGFQINGQTEAQAIVTVNGTEVEVNKFGQFSYNIADLVEGENIIVFTATDLSGNITTIEKLVYVDRTAPQVLEASIAPSPAVVGDTIALNVYAVDEGVGVGEVNAEFWSPSGNLVYFYGYYDEATNRWIAKTQVNDYMEPGTYTLAELYVADLLDNYQYLSQNNFPNLTFEVVNPNYDVMGPVVNSVEVTPKTVKPGGTITVTIDAYDPNGITAMGGTFYDTYGWNSIYMTPYYNEESGKWEATITVPTNASGEYYLSYLYLYDNKGNYSYYYASDFPDVTFTVSDVATLKLTPAVQEVKPGDTFSVNVDVENVTDLYGAEARIYYDNTKLTVVDADLEKEGTQIMVAGVAGDLTVKNEVNDDEIWFSVAKQGNLDPTGFTGSGTIATITFQALEEAKDLTYVYFTTTELSDAGDPPQGIPHGTEDAEIKILSNGSIDGYVRLQGLYNYEGANVSLMGTGITTQTDMAGYFKFEEVPAGHYTLVVSSPDWKTVFLTQGIPVDVDYNQNTTLDQIVLLTGDVNSDNKIGLTDLSKMAAAYSSYEGDANWNGNADLNDSYHVELFDLVLMAKNWKKVGYEAKNYFISGTVIDDTTGEPIPYALVTVAGANESMDLVADGNGYFEVPVAKGTYTVTASKEGYKGGQVSAMVDASNPEAEVTLLLTPDTPVNQTATLGGFVTDENSYPMADAVVTVSGGEQTNGVFLSTYTTANGTFFFEDVNINDVNGVPITEFTIKVYKSGYATETLVISGLTAGEIVTNQFTLKQINQGAPIYQADFEYGSDWETTGFWHRVANNADIYNTAVGDYVYLPEGDYSNGELPDTPNGSYAYWYGQDETGSFIGTQVEGDYPLSGGTSTAPNEGSLTSPVIDLTNATNPILNFQSWWEVESINPNAAGFDLMSVKVYSVSNDTYYDLGRLNPWIDPNQEDREHLAFTSGGFNRPAVWVPYSFNLEQFAGQQIKLQFSFDTVDGLYNGFRGWMVDDVTIHDGTWEEPANYGIQWVKPSPVPNYQQSR